MRAFQNRSGHCGRGGEQRFIFGRLRQKRFAGRAHKKRVVQSRQLIEMGQNFGILFLAFAEAKAGIDDDALPLHARVPCAVHRRLEFAGDGSHHILHWRKLRPHLRQAAHVVQNETGIGVCRYLGEVRVESEAARVVEDLDAVFQRAFSNLRLVGIE